MFNLPIINIPGPQFPLYFENSELTHYFGSSPLFDGIGIALMIASYQGKLTFTATSDLGAEKEIPLTKYIDEAIKRIESASESTADQSVIKSGAEGAVGIIEDALDFAGNLFSFASKSPKD